MVVRDCLLFFCYQFLWRVSDSNFHLKEDSWIRVVDNAEVIKLKDFVIQQSTTIVQDLVTL